MFCQMFITFVGMYKWYHESVVGCLNIFDLKVFQIKLIILKCLVYNVKAYTFNNFKWHF